MPFLRRLYKQPPSVWGPVSEVKTSVFKNAEKEGIDKSFVLSAMSLWSPGQQVDYVRSNLSDLVGVSHQNKAIYHPGTGTTDKINVGNVPIFSGLTKCIWCFPFIPDDTLGYRTWFSNFTGGSQILIRKSNNTDTTFYIFIANSTSDPGNNYVITNNVGYIAKTLTNLVVAYDGSKSTNATKVRIFCNGKEVGQASSGGTIPTSLLITSIIIC